MDEAQVCEALESLKKRPAAATQRMYAQWLTFAQTPVPRRFSQLDAIGLGEEMQRKDVTRFLRRNMLLINHWLNER